MEIIEFYILFIMDVNSYLNEIFITSIGNECDKYIEASEEIEFNYKLSLLRSIKKYFT